MDGDPIPVVVDVGPGRIGLHANGNEIGDWARDECRIVPGGEGNYLILAEDEELPFAPADVAAFNEALEIGPKVAPPPVSHRHLDEAEPGRLTMLGFYLLAAVTSVLGLWAIWSLVA